MAKWSDIANTKEFQSLPPFFKAIRQGRFFSEVVSKSKKFNELDPSIQEKIKEKFIVPTKETLSYVLSNPKANLGVITAFKKGDEFIEKIAKTIEPTVPPGRTTLGLMTKDLPRQVTAEMLRGYKPTTLLTLHAAGKFVKPIAKPIGRHIWRKVPEPIKGFLLREFTVGKGAPKAYLESIKKTSLAKAAGARESEQIAKTLSLAPEKMNVVTKTGKEIITKKGKPLSLEHQEYIGRLFRKEVDLGGKRPFMSPEQSRLMFKNIEVEVGLNPRIGALKKRLGLISKQLSSPKERANALVGKVFRTKTGKIEKITKIAEVPKYSKAGKLLKRKDIKLVSEPVTPKTGYIPKDIFPEDDILREIKQIRQADTLVKPLALERKQLLQQRKVVAEELTKRVKDIEVGVRANHSLFDRTFTEQIRNNPRFKELSEIASEGRVIMDKWSKELVKSGVPKKEAVRAIEENVGSYMKRSYASKLAKPTGKGYSAKDLRIRLNSIKKKKDLSYDVRKAMGEIKTPALPSGVAVKQISDITANAKLFKAVAGNPEWVAGSNVTGKMIQMPGTDSMGALKGKWVIPEI
ncbi:MAG: hypothetical protein ABIB11_03445, partial [Candidatus Omnitrophota bacterium]